MRLEILLTIVLVTLLGSGVCDDAVIPKDDSNTSDIEIVGYSDDCGESSICDGKMNLICSVSTKLCVCDDVKGFFYEPEAKGCVHFESDIDYTEMDDSDEAYSAENESEEEKDADAGADDVTIGSDINEETDVKKSNNDETKWPEKEENWDLPEFKNKTVAIPSGSDSIDDDDKDSDENVKIEKALEKLKLQPRTQTENEIKKPAETDINKSADDYDDWWMDSDEEYDKNYKIFPEAKVATNNWPKWEDSDEYDKDDADYHNCISNLDCVNSKFGRYSQCDSDEGNCKCSDTEGQSRELSFVNGTCYVSKEFGSDCTNHDECQAVMNGPAWCHLDQETEKRFCTCQPFHIWDGDFKQCLPHATEGLESSCRNDLQCSAPDALGVLAKCSEVTLTCECILDPTVIFYDGKCVYEHALKDRCNTDQECRGSLGVHAYCDIETSQCACEEGHICSRFFLRPAMSPYTLFIIVTIGASIAIGGVLCIALRRRRMEDTYSFIRDNGDV